jgi:hypothetical protein
MTVRTKAMQVVHVYITSLGNKGRTVSSPATRLPFTFGTFSWTCFLRAQTFMAGHQ